MLFKRADFIILGGYFNLINVAYILLISSLKYSSLHNLRGIIPKNLLLVNKVKSIRHNFSSIINKKETEKSGVYIVNCKHCSSTSIGETSDFTGDCTNTNTIFVYR